LCVCSGENVDSEFSEIEGEATGPIYEIKIIKIENQGIKR